MDPTVGVHHVGGHAVPHNAVNWVAWVNLFQICLFFSEHQHSILKAIEIQYKPMYCFAVTRIEAVSRMMKVAWIR